MTVLSTLRSVGEPLRRLLEQWLDRVRLRLSKTKRSTQLAAALSFSLTLLAGIYTARSWRRARATEQARAHWLLRRNSGLRGRDGSRTLYVPYRSTTAKVVIHPTKPTTFDAHRRLFLNPPRAAGLSAEGSQDGSALAGPGAPPPTTKPGLNLAFLHQYLSLLSIMIPRWNSKESGLLLSQGMFLLLRTYLSLVVARLDGVLVRDLVAGRGRDFLWGIVKWCGVGGVAAYTNAAIKYLQNKVSIAFRTRLTRYIHDLYLHKSNYYSLVALDGGLGLGAGAGADQFITQDLTQFCDAAAALYANVGKPLVDLVVFNYQLGRALGPLAFTALLTNYIATAALLRRASPPFGRLKAVEGRREGEFRRLHARLITHAEEVAFYGGSDIEKVVLDRGFRELRLWMEGIYRLKVRYNMLEDFVLKYAWSAFGYLVASLPVFLPAWGGLGGVQELLDAAETVKSSDHRERDRMKDFITNKRLMLALADAGGRIMYSLKDLAELAGYTSRIYALISTLHRVHAHAYFAPRDGPLPEAYSLADVHGTVQRGYEGVRLENVPVIAPAAPYPRGSTDTLLEPALSFIVQPGMHLLINGPNGVGKTSIARILAGLWPAYRGLVSRPRDVGADGIMFLPQRPYLSVGTLRDQVRYPSTDLDVSAAASQGLGYKSDADLQVILDTVYLGYLPAREGGFDALKNWATVLSGGERQRLAFARLLYHVPRFAVLDEATSAVSADVEGLLYQAAQQAGITLLTISTRASLRRYHTFVLQLGSGETGRGWSWERIGTEAEKMGRERERNDLQAKLALVDGWRARRREIEQELGEVWVKHDPKSPGTLQIEGVAMPGQQVEATLEQPGYLASAVEKT